MTNIQTLVSTTANIVRIVSLKPGDVYKRLEESSYGGATMQIGIVSEVLNNGDRCAVTAIEYKGSYGGVEVETRVFTDKANVTLFPATPDEVHAHLDDLTKAAERKAEKAEAELRSAREVVVRVREITRNAENATLTAAAIEAGEQA